ncbi:MAG: phospho-N-acetylmuramoyl-pentapeptide-transferase [Candidatus Dasytiphilus stammeri]
MLIWIITHLTEFFPSLKIFHSIIFRAFISLITAFLFTIIMELWLIRKMLKFKFGQVVRHDGPQSHWCKKGIPTMGGLIIIISIMNSIFLWAHLSNPYIWFVLFVLVGYGLIGFIDDYQKIMLKNSQGLIAYWKYFFQSIIALLILLVLFFWHKNPVETTLMMPWNWIIYLCIAYFTIIGTSNAVNLTDGLDGLAIIPTIFVAAGLGLVAWFNSNSVLSNYLHIAYLPVLSELVIICSTIIGSGLAFLWFNTYPAQVFMGDIGSLALGATLGIISILLRQELLLLVMGGIFVIETLSVIIQVGSFKFRGKRIFLMAPLHHHYELKGLPEPRITIRFGIISFMLVLIGLVIKFNFHLNEL